MTTLLLTDFMMEADVTLTKIETIDEGDEVVGWTSSAFAGFCLPPLFFVVRNLFERFFAFAYSIRLVLVFYGLQLVLENWIRVPPLVGCGLMTVAMTISIIVSASMDMGPRKSP